MAKQWVKQQLHRNELQDVVDKGLIWTLKNRQTALMAGGGVLAAILILGGALYHRRNQQAAAWERLSLAQYSAYSGQLDAALKQIEELKMNHAGSRASAFGLLFAGDIQYRQGLYKEAVGSYSVILENSDAKFIQPLALANTAMAQEASAQFSQALATDQRFLDAYSDHFMAPQVHASIARCQQALGQSDQAKVTYQKITLQYPDTPWARWAQERLSAKITP